MKSYIQDIEEMSDSREMLEAKPYSFMIGFIYLLIVLFTISFTWAYFGEIEDYVKANGVVRPGDPISTITNSLAGRVDQSYIEEGKQVKKGDVLYTLERENLLLERDEKAHIVAGLEKEKDGLTKLKQSIITGKNMFSLDKTDEVDNYNRFEKYIMDKKISVEVMNNNKSDQLLLKAEAESSKKMVQVNLKEGKELLKQQKKLLQSVEQNKNLMQDIRSQYGRRYEDYELGMKKLKMIYEQKKTVCIKKSELYAAGGVCRKEAEEAKNQEYTAKLEMDKFRNEFVISVHNELKKNEHNIDQLSSSLVKWNKDLQVSTGKTYSTEILRDKIRLDMLVQTDEVLSVNQIALDKAKSDLKTIQLRLKEATIISPIEGVINLHGEVNRGDLLQSGVEVASVVPGASLAYKVHLHVSNKDISSIKEGQQIRFHFLALPYQQYGELQGVIRKIGTDARVEKETGASYYKVEATVEKKELASDKGIKEKIKTGMLCEAQVITKSTKILWWLFEKMNLMS